MGKPKKKHKKAKQLPLSKEEQIFQAARDLAAEIGISLVFERLFYPGYVAMAQIRFYGILAFNRKSLFCLSALPPFSTTMS